MKGNEIMLGAASLMILRNPDDPEVYWVQRRKTDRFLPGFHAFPGGKIDVEDLDAAAGDLGKGARIAAIREAYASRGALDDTMFVFISDHGMELQDPVRAVNMNALIAESGVQTSFVSTGLVYLRTLELETTRNGTSIRVRVLNHDDAQPQSGASSGG